MYLHAFIYKRSYSGVVHAGEHNASAGEIGCVAVVHGVEQQLGVVVYVHNRAHHGLASSCDVGFSARQVDQCFICSEPEG